MGFLGGDNESNDEGNALLNEQIQTNRAELEAKRQNLYQTRLDIIKGQGAENWTPDYNKRAPVGHPGMAPEFKFFGHRFKME